MADVDLPIAERHIVDPSRDRARLRWLADPVRIHALSAVLRGEPLDVWRDDLEGLLLALTQIYEETTRA